ncbi:Transposable element Hobo transposase [Folsomia candida]|uniref:Transposable element Hobo transposase n=1 Tax=Folsomia candida TaxID=158441 RepID=A0A226DTC8_FOLCA|nr:Transposable element Hobo transposase [Folsomia candida]
MVTLFCGHPLLLLPHLRKNVPSGAVAALNEDVVIGLAQDLRPLNSVGSRGFLKIAKSLIHFGAMYGDQDPKSILKHRTTLKREFLHKLVDAKRNDISMLVGAAPQFPFFAFTSDMWSDKYRQRSFLSLSIHYINNNWKLTSHMLGVDEFTEDHKTTINIRQQCRPILSKFFGNNVDDVMTNSWIVTDSGSNMLHIFEKREPCLCHRLNTCVEGMFNKKPTPTATQVANAEKNGREIHPKKFFSFKESCPRFHGALVSIKDVVTYFKQSSLNSKLTSTLKQEVATRWNSELIMLESYLKAATESDLRPHFGGGGTPANDPCFFMLNFLWYNSSLENPFTATLHSVGGSGGMLMHRAKSYFANCSLTIWNGKINKLSNIDNESVKELVDFLRPFEECTKVFSQDSQPTLHQIAPWFHKLHQHLEINEDDSDELKLLKGQAMICFAEYCKTSTMHYVAALLNPK